VRIFKFLLLILVFVPAAFGDDSTTSASTIDVYQQCLSAKKAERPPEDRTHLPTDSSLNEWRNQQLDSESLDCRTSIAASQISATSGNSNDYGSAYTPTATSAGTIAEYYSSKSTSGSSSSAGQSESGGQQQSGGGGASSAPRGLSGSLSN
jgi:hypothetical protein